MSKQPVHIQLYDPRDPNDAIKLAKMSPWQREMCLGQQPSDRGYGEIGPIDSGEEGLGS